MYVLPAYVALKSRKNGPMSCQSRTGSSVTLELRSSR
jgi:hypothetical protein